METSGSKKERSANKMIEEICGTCKYSYQEPSEGAWVCNCEDSEGYRLDIAYNDTCKEWEDKNE